MRALSSLLSHLRRSLSAHAPVSVRTLHARRRTRINRLARQRRGIDSTTARLVSVNKELAHKMWSGTKFAPANADAGQSERGGGDSLDADLMLPSSSEEGDGDGAESEGGEDGDKAEDESEDASAKDDEESAAEEDSEEGGKAPDKLRMPCSRRIPVRAQRERPRLKRPLHVGSMWSDRQQICPLTRITTFQCSNSVHSSHTHSLRSQTECRGN